MKQYITKILCLSLLSLMICIYANAQNNRWEVYLGEPNRIDYADDLIETYDGGYLLVGGYDGIDGMNIKTDKNGNLLYEKDIQYINDMVVMAAVQDSNGNTYQCGFLVIEGTVSWPYLAKYDSCGNKIWCSTYYGIQEYEYGWFADIAFGNNEEVIVLGYLGSSAQNKQIFLFGFDTDGNNNWINAYATKDDHPLIANAVAYHLIKKKNEYILNGFCYWPFPGDTNHVYLRPFFIGIDSSYNEKWIMPFAVMDSVFGDAFSCISLNDSILVGVGTRWIEDNSKNSLIMFFNSNGEELGYFQIQNNEIGNNISYNVSLDIEKINDSVLITSSVWGNVNNERIQGELVLSINGNINKLTERTEVHGNPKLIKTSDSNFVVMNEVKISSNDWDILLYKINESLETVPLDTNQYNYDSLCPHQITSGTIDLSDCMIWTNTEEIPSPEDYYASLTTIPVKAFPNPANDKVTFAFENTDKHKNIHLECYNIFGQEVHEQKIYTGQLEAEAEVSEWGKGIYIVVVKSNGKVMGKGKFVVE